MLGSWEFQQKHEVGRVTSCCEDTLSNGCLVDWGHVALGDWNIIGFDWFEPEHWAFRVKNFWFRLVKDELLVVPSTTFHEHACNKHAILWYLNISFIRDDFEVVTKQIDSNSVLSSIVLLVSCQETMGKEEFSNPKNIWKTRV